MRCGWIRPSRTSFSSVSRPTSRRTGSKQDSSTASGVSSMIRLTPVTASNARMLRPSRPMMRPFMSSLGRCSTDTTDSAVCSLATRWIASVDDLAGPLLALVLRLVLDVAGDQRRPRAWPGSRSAATSSALACSAVRPADPLQHLAPLLGRRRRARRSRYLERLLVSASSRCPLLQAAGLAVEPLLPLGEPLLAALQVLPERRADPRARARISSSASARGGRGCCLRGLAPRLVRGLRRVGAGPWRAIWSASPCGTGGLGAAALPRRAPAGAARRGRSRERPGPPAARTQQDALHEVDPSSPRARLESRMPCLARIYCAPVRTAAQRRTSADTRAGSGRRVSPPLGELGHGSGRRTCPSYQPGISSWNVARVVWQTRVRSAGHSFTARRTVRRGHEVSSRHSNHAGPGRGRAAEDGRAMQSRRSAPVGALGLSASRTTR